MSRDTVKKRFLLCGLVVTMSACSGPPERSTQTYTMASGSMEPTLKVNQAITVTAVPDGHYTPHHGDIVVFKAPPGWFDQGAGGACNCTFKRVIGIPGDSVTSAGAGEPIKVNGVALSEPYVFPGDMPSMEQFDVTVPSGQLWVMGDHRDVSMDSRAHMSVAGNGFVPAADVIGIDEPK